MSIVICPKCKSPNDDAPHDGNSLICSICNNHWCPSAATIDSIPTAEIPHVRSTPRAQHVTTPLAREFIARTASGEYLPEEPATDQAKKALTERVDGRQSSLQPVPGGLPTVRPGNSQMPTLDLLKRTPAEDNSPGQHSPPHPAIPARKPKASHNPETGRTIDSDLFDRLEEEARYKRSEMKTVPELTYSDPDKFRTSVPHSDHSAKVICPVCGHSYTSQGTRHTCPQCGTAYDEDSQRIAAGAGTKDNLIGRNLRGCLIDRKLGEGGMGTVYHAKQLSLDRSVAVKVLPVDLARNKNFIQRFEREAKSLARINHPNILQIYDFGDDPQLGLYFMVIEFVEGLDLGEVLNRRGLLGQIEVLDLLRQAVSGLEAAAEKGVIHRDIKPDNLMIGLNGLVKVSDFGLAKGYVAQVGVTAAGVRVGTPAFMSPEQCDGVEVDYRSDVYNLGATAFLCLTGRLPFDGETPFAIMLKHKTEAVPSLCEIDPTIDHRVDGLISRLLAKKPAQRCDSLRELLETIEYLESELAGTESVLRKSRGPFKAMLLGEPPMPTVASGDNPPVVSPRLLPVLDQVELVELPPAPLFAATSLNPGQNSGGRRASAGSSSGNLRRGTDIPAAIPATPFEVAALPLADKSGQRPSRRLDVELQQARERGRRSQLDTVIANGDRLAEDGSFFEAAEAWTEAAELAGGDPALRKDLLKRAGAARRRSGTKRFVRIFCALMLLLIGLATAVWLSTPNVHNWLARQRLQVLTDGFADVTPRQQITELRGFAASNRAPWGWYIALFRRPYTVDASVEALHLADELDRRPVQPVKDPSQASGPGPEISAVLALVKDPQVTWDTVAQQARNLLVAAQKQGRDLTAFVAVDEALRLAESELALQAEDLQQISAARSQGEHVKALSLSETFRARHVRAMPIFIKLPLPARIRIEVSALELPSSLSLQVDGIAVTMQPAAPSAAGAPAAEAIFCRNGDHETAVEVSAEDFTSQRQIIAGSTLLTERTLAMSLRPATIWQVAFANPAATATFVAWARVHPISNGNLVLQHRDGVLVLRQTDGAVLARAERSTPTSPGFGSLWFPVDENRMLMAREDGAVDVTGSATLIPEQTLHRGKGEVLAWSALDLAMQNGKQIHAAIERTSTGAALIAQDPAREYWRYNNLKVVNQIPAIIRHDDRLYVFDDSSLHLLEEDGAVVRVFNLAARSGAPIELAINGRRELLVPTNTGVQRLQLGNHQSPVRSIADPALAGLGSVQLVLAGDHVLAASDRQVTLLTCKATSVLVWQHEQSRPLGALPILGKDHAITIDDQGLITVRTRGQGALVQKIAHGIPLCGPAGVITLSHGSAVVVTDRAGKAAAYALRR